LDGAPGVSALANHLWQSLLCVALVQGLVLLTRRNAASLRLWLWRAATIKLMVPFTVLTGLGGWLGFPVRFAGDPPPASLLELAAKITPWLRPADWLSSQPARAVLLVVLLLVAVLAARRCFGGIHREALRARSEELRLESDPDDREPSVGFVRAALMTACVLTIAAVPLLGGALHASAR
jgi:hypothetical protein